MTLGFRRSFLIAAVGLGGALAAPSPTVAQPRRLITETDLLRFVWIADPQVSPDGKQVAFVRVVVNEKTDDYESSLWVVPADGSEPPRALTPGTKDTGPRWAPDGRRLAFVRTVTGQAPQIYILMGGGDAVKATDLPKGAAGPVWSPDGTRIAFSSSGRPDDLDKPPGAPAAAPKSDVRVITSAAYRSNGGGWNDPDRPTHLWVIDVGAQTTRARALTTGRYAETLQAWSPDGSRVYFTTTRADEPYFAPQETELYAAPAAGGNPARVGLFKGSMGSLRPSPDGRTLAFVGSLNPPAERSYDQPDLFVLPADGSGAPYNLTASYDFDINGGIGGDQTAPRGGRSAGPLWTPDGKSIVIAAGERGDAVLVRIRADAAPGPVAAVVDGRRAVQSYSMSADGRTLVALVSTPTAIGDLFTVDLAAPGTRPPAPKQITRINESLFNTLNLSEPEAVSWKSFDGRTIEGWLMHPPGFDRTRKYPFVLEIHGGPHSAYGNTFTHEFQMLAARGYVVLFPNPRGSSNYGQDFGNIIQYHYPGDDYRDLMAGVNEVVKRGYIDTTKLGVTGGSGGGLLTNWTVTQTTRFAAAVSQRDIADWYGFWFSADFTQYTPSWFRKPPWEDPKDYADRSPITHVGAVKTPMLFVLGDDDLRTPPADGGEMMFRALKYMKIPTVMVRFPGETHELSRSGKPGHRIERLRHIAGWFDTWLLGKTGLYDLKSR